MLKKWNVWSKYFQKNIETELQNSKTKDFIIEQGNMKPGKLLQFKKLLVFTWHPDLFNYF